MYVRRDFLGACIDININPILIILINQDVGICTINFEPLADIHIND